MGDVYKRQPQTIIKTKIIKCYDPASHGLVIRNDGSKSKEYVAKQRCVGWKTNWSGRSASVSYTHLTLPM